MEVSPPITRRLILHQKLVDLLGSPNVYFQPPDNLTMKYPAIVYVRDYSKVMSADNLPYIWAKRYQVTNIDPDPDSETLDILEAFPFCSYIRHFETDELHHNIFNLYF